MQNEQLPALGVSQIREVETKPVIKIGNDEWRLKRDASDPSTTFAHDRVNWIEQGCDKVFNQPFYACWIKGIILPSPGSLEKTQQVMYVGFHSKQIDMSPAFLTINDLKCMHVYTRSEPNFPSLFINSFLGIDAIDDSAREPISAMPPKTMMTKKKVIADAETNNE
ncbi:MAG: hypothetical protein ACRCUH_15045 [Shewanella sp.]